MKLLHTADPDTLLQLEARSLRRKVDLLTADLAAARATIAELRRAEDMLLDETAFLHVLPDAERLIPRPDTRAWIWSHWDTSAIDTDQAHAVMQQHRGCLTEDCPRRRTAVETLRANGHMKADSGRPATW
jgi:hypothetical protein